MRPNGNQEITGPVLFQSTHPHGVRPERSDKGQGRPGVSIHAPTRGATQHKQRLGGNTEFQSTHPHGVRPGCRKALFLPVSRFNPRTHTGCDAVRLPRGSTPQSFNPRTHTGCDGDSIRGNDSSDLFQSTHPHGVRQIIVPLHRKQKTVSIHAPTRGATVNNQHAVYLVLVSIHAPTRGATITAWGILRRTPVFQSTHPHGVRL